MRSTLFAVLLAVGCPLVACSPSVDCPDIFIPAVTVTVVNSQGSVQKDARVSFSVNGGPLREAVCNGSQASGCDTWHTLGESGDYFLRATSADGSRFVEQRLHVDGDECHPVGQSVRLSLPD
jgi:hypothetical protein